MSDHSDRQPTPSHSRCVSTTHGYQFGLHTCAVKCNSVLQEYKRTGASPQTLDIFLESSIVQFQHIRGGR